MTVLDSEESLESDYDERSVDDSRPEESEDESASECSKSTSLSLPDLTDESSREDFRK